MVIKAIIMKVMLIKNPKVKIATYTAYEPRYAYQNSTGRNNYGDPTYNNWYKNNKYYY